MNSQALWQRYQKYLYDNESLGLSLDISRMNFEEPFLQEIEPRLQHAYEAMQELEAGAIANPDEQRMVGHYWLRDPDRAPGRNGVMIKQMLKAIKVFVSQIHSSDIAPERAPRFKICYSWHWRFGIRAAIRNTGSQRSGFR